MCCKGNRIGQSPMGKAVVVLIVSPLTGHITPAMEMAKVMVARSNQLSIVVLVTKMPNDDPKGNSKIDSITNGYAHHDRLQVLYLPTPEDLSQWDYTDRPLLFARLKEWQKVHVREIVSKIKGLTAFIVDATNNTMVQVADEIGLPSYVFFASGAAFLGLLLHFQALEDEHHLDLNNLSMICSELVIPSFANPLPVSVIPALIKRLVHFVRGYRKVTAILVNTTHELEAYAFDSFDSNGESSYGNLRLPPICPVGPLIHWPKTNCCENEIIIMDWLNVQPPSSVVFLCFGSKGTFHSDQVKEIAHGLERSGQRFLWSLRKPATKRGEFPTDYENYGAILPEGFLDRTAKIGKVVGWVPQLAVLSHASLGGFVSHCGWNSTLESIWCGVPIATWPLQGDQQLNAFQLVKELGVAVEISLDYDQSREYQAMVTADQIENGIRRLMDSENEVRKKMNELSKRSRLAMEEGGSSYLSFQKLLQEF